MPEYQDVNLEQLEVLRILFGFFPTYRLLFLSSACRPEYYDMSTKRAVTVVLASELSISQEVSL